MSEQITALLAKLQEDADLREKLQGANDLDAAEALVKEAGFDVTKADWLRYLEEQSLELSDKELSEVAGGCGKKDPMEPGGFLDKFLSNEALAEFTFGVLKDPNGGGSVSRSRRR
jgi:predicted ribosomally synthesized peptide with nif11-like leader